MGNGPADKSLTSKHKQNQTDFGKHLVIFSTNSISHDQIEHFHTKQHYMLVTTASTNSVVLAYIAPT